VRQQRQVGSDITYHPRACEDLLRSLCDLCPPPPTDPPEVSADGRGAAPSEDLTEGGVRPVVYLGHLDRGDEEIFFSRLARHFHVKEVRPLILASWCPGLKTL
jgi:hypothetical protein